MNILAPLYAASDVFTFPGDVGLGPLQALCYDLPVITLESPTHMPEIIYLNKSNSIILPNRISLGPGAAADNQPVWRPIWCNNMFQGIGVRSIRL